MNEDWQIFDFESDLAGTLRCIPMIVRFKLDLCRIKLSLRQWSRFSHDERAQLVRQACDTSPNLQLNKDYLLTLIENRTGDNAVATALDDYPEWKNLLQAPTRVIDYATNCGLMPPRSEGWAALTDLQRFALIKLSQQGHDNDNFAPAIREFGLMSNQP